MGGWRNGDIYILEILISDKPTTQHGGGDIYGDLDLVPESMNRVSHTTLSPPALCPTNTTCQNRSRIHLMTRVKKWREVEEDELSLSIVMEPYWLAWSGWGAWCRHRWWWWRRRGRGRWRCGRLSPRGWRAYTSTRRRGKRHESSQRNHVSVLPWI